MKQIEHRKIQLASIRDGMLKALLVGPLAEQVLKHWGRKEEKTERWGRHCGIPLSFRRKLIKRCARVLESDILDEAGTNGLKYGPSKRSSSKFTADDADIAIAHLARAIALLRSEEAVPMIISGATNQLSGKRNEGVWIERLAAQMSGDP